MSPVSAREQILRTAASGRALPTIWRELRARPSALFLLGLLTLVVLLCLLGPLLSPWAYDQIDFAGVWSAPPGTPGHWWGTDDIGHDLFTRCTDGGRISLLAGLVASLVSLLIGVVYGSVAGFFGGVVDEVMMRIVDLLYAVPFMFLVIVLRVVFGGELLMIFLAIGVINWLDMARIVRGQTLALRDRPFVAAAKIGGLTNAAILARHIVPNLIDVVVVYATLTVPQVILSESFLSFLGLGVQAPRASWGALVDQGSQALYSTPWGMFWPAAFLCTTLVCLNVLGDALRDALDPRGEPK
jgi:oligopeptide transport system permease protein